MLDVLDAYIIDQINKEEQRRREALRPVLQIEIDPREFERSPRRADVDVDEESQYEFWNFSLSSSTHPNVNEYRCTV